MGHVPLGWCPQGSADPHTAGTPRPPLRAPFPEGQDLSPWGPGSIVCLALSVGRAAGCPVLPWGAPGLVSQGVQPPQNPSVRGWAQAGGQQVITRRLGLVLVRIRLNTCLTPLLTPRLVAGRSPRRPPRAVRRTGPRCPGERQSRGAHRGVQDRALCRQSPGSPRAQPPSVGVQLVW